MTMPKEDVFDLTIRLDKAADQRKINTDSRAWVELRNVLIQEFNGHVEELEKENFRMKKELEALKKQQELF